MAAKPYTDEELKEREQRLISDLKKLEGGWIPTLSDLDDAPFLDCWTVHIDGPGLMYFAGECVGHPRIRDGYMTTSYVVAGSIEDGWIRTASRFFRIGQRLEETLTPAMRH